MVGALARACLMLILATLATCPCFADVDDAKWQSLIERLPNDQAEVQLDEILARNMGETIQAERRGLRRAEKLLKENARVISSKRLEAMRFSAARLAFACAQNEKSMELARQCLADNYRAPALIARNCIILKRLNDAMSAIAVGLERSDLPSSERGDLIYLRGQTNMLLSRVDRSIDDYFDAVHLLDRRSDAWLGLIHALNQKRRYSEALREVNLYLKLKRPESWQFYQLGTVAALFCQDYDTAYRFDLRARKLGLRNSPYQTRLLTAANVLLRDGRQADLEKLITHRTTYLQPASFFANLGAECLIRKCDSLARKCFERIREPVNIALLCKIVRLEMDCKMGDLARTHVNMILAREPKHHESLYTLSKILVEDGKFTAAREVLAPLTSDLLGREKALTEQAKVLLLEGKELAAESIIEKLKAENPDRDYSLEKLKLRYRCAANLEVVRRLMRRAVREDLARIQEALRKPVDSSARGALLFRAAQCELLLEDGKNCLRHTDEVIAMGNDGYASRNMRAAALDLLQENSKAALERDAILDTFVKSGDNPFLSPRLGATDAGCGAAGGGKR